MPLRTPRLLRGEHRMGRCARHRSVGKGRPARRCPPLSPDPCLRKGQGQGLPRLGAWATMRPRATFTTKFCPLRRHPQSRRLDPPAVLALCARLQLTSLRSRPPATSAVHRGHSVAGSQLLANCCAVCANRRTTKTERKEMAQAQVPAHVITRETQHKPPRQAGNVGVAAIPPPRQGELIPNRQAHEALESNGMLWLGMPLLFFAHVGHVASTLTHTSCRG